MPSISGLTPTIQCDRLMELWVGQIMAKVQAVQVQVQVHERNQRSDED